MAGALYVRELPRCCAGPTPASDMTCRFSLTTAFRLISSELPASLPLTLLSRVVNSCGHARTHCNTPPPVTHSLHTPHHPDDRAFVPRPGWRCWTVLPSPMTFPLPAPVRLTAFTVRNAGCCARAPSATRTGDTPSSALVRLVNDMAVSIVRPLIRFRLLIAAGAGSLQPLSCSVVDMGHCPSLPPHGTPPEGVDFTGLLPRQTRQARATQRCSAALPLRARTPVAHTRETRCRWRHAACYRCLWHCNQRGANSYGHLARCTQHISWLLLFTLPFYLYPVMVYSRQVWLIT